MSDQGFWNNDWMEVQRSYWENMTEFSRKALGLQAPPKSPWESAMDHWWEAVSPAAPDMASGFMEKMMDQGKTFFHMAEQFNQRLQVNGARSDWSDIFNKTFSSLQAAFTQGGGGKGDDALHKMMAFWEMPSDNWQRMVSSLSLTPGDTLRNMPHDPKAQFERFLSAPGLGYSREEEGQQKETMLKMMEYQQALQEYMQFFSNIGVLSVDRMRTEIEGLAQKGAKIESARALYDTWVGACEAVYSEQVMTPEYASIHGRLVNSLMAVKQRMSVMVEEYLGTFNVPTRTELRTLQMRMQEDRRAIKALRAEVSRLKTALAGAREQAQAQTPVQTQAPTPKAKAAPKRKASPKKKAVAKKGQA
jgi:class III poly(R)-hydroxyalkanoic acid synthase PhaE subunit